jgi:hypothetical protein
MGLEFRESERPCRASYHRQCVTGDRRVAWHDPRMKSSDLVARYPRVFHAASAVAWPSIQQHGLLSTVRLLDLFGVDRVERHELLTRTRREPTRLEAPGLPPAVIRDQKPMKFVAEKIEPGYSLVDFLMAINSRVFFWATRDRLDRLRNARQYRDDAQVLLHIDTRGLVDRYEQQIGLCRFNSGAITQRNHPVRSHVSWVPISRYPYEEYRRRYGGQRALAEVTVLESVPDVLELTVDVEHLTSPTRSRA